MSSKCSFEDMEHEQLQIIMELCTGEPLVSRLTLHRRNSSPSSEHGALGRGSQALSAGSTVRSKIAFSNNNEEQGTDGRTLP